LRFLTAVRLPRCSGIIIGRRLGTHGRLSSLSVHVGAHLVDGVDLRLHGGWQLGLVFRDGFSR
jgi:hypothetical protein